MFKINRGNAGANVARTIRFTETLYTELNRLSEQNMISFNELVLQCCQYALEHLDQDNDTTTNE